MSSGSVNFIQTQVISSAKTIDIKGAATDVSFSNIRFEGSSPQLSLVVGGETVSVCAKNITVNAGTAASITGGLEVCNLELGAESSLSKDVGSSSMIQGCRLKLEYRLSSQFADIPDFVEPNSIILSYIGETETSVRYSSFINKPKTIKVFTGDDHVSQCNNWLSRSSLASDIYPEFRSDSQIVSLICISNSSASTFALNVTNVAEGETEIIEPNNKDEDFSTVQPATETKNVGVDSDDSSSNSNGNNDGLSVGAIVGIVVAVVIVVVGLIALLIWMFVIRKKKDEIQSSGEETDVNSIANKMQTKSTPNNNNIKIERENEENSDTNESSDDYDFWM